MKLKLVKPTIVALIQLAQLCLVFYQAYYSFTEDIYYVFIICFVVASQNEELINFDQAICLFFFTRYGQWKRNM